MIRRNACVAAFLFMLGAGPVRGQDTGLELQWYPAGVILAGRMDVGQSTTLFAGFNRTNRRDWGVHDDEMGFGWGVGVGRRVWGTGAWAVEYRADLWRLNIDWVDLRQGGRVGSTTVYVFQPTLRVMREFTPVDALTLRPGLGLGAEMNVRTDGEPVGQGPILLLGVSVLFRVM